MYFLHVSDKVTRLTRISRVSSLRDFFAYTELVPAVYTLATQATGKCKCVSITVGRS